MDSRTWLWRKRSQEKTIIAAKAPGMLAKGPYEETEKLEKREETGPALPSRNLNEKLASVLLECHVKGDLATIQEELVEETAAGQPVEVTEVDCLRKQLDEALRQGAAANERLLRSESALKQCMQQLSSLREEQEQITKDTLMKASSEFLTAQEVLEEKLMETSQRLTNVVVENTNLSKALLVKEKLIDELHKHVSQKAAESHVLMVRLDASEKESAFLKYEMHILEKELEVRNEELEYNRHSIDASHRQHVENVQKISKLEAECQRLQGLAKKRLPGPASYMKTRSEVATSGWERSESRRKANPVRDLILRNTPIDKSPTIPPEDMSFFIEQLRIMEEDNNVLKGLLNKKNAELQSSRTMYSLTASRLSQVEARLLELSRSQRHRELAKCSHGTNCELGSDEGVCSAGSWANVLVTDLDHFEEEKLNSPLVQKTAKTSEMSLMDDFVEVEKLAMVSVQAPGASACKHLSADKELIPVVKGQSGGARENAEIHRKCAANEEPFDWLQVVLKAISKQRRISKRSLSELIQDIKIALGCIDEPKSQAGDGKKSSQHPTEADFGGYITWNPPSDADPSMKEVTTEELLRPSLRETVSKIIKLIERMIMRPSLKNAVSEAKKEQSILPLAMSEEYFIRTFQWRSSELSSVLERFVHSCNGLLTRKISLENFVEILHFTLEWIISSRVAQGDTSSARDKIKKHFGWSELPHQNEEEVAMDGLPMSEEKPSRRSSLHDQDMSFRMERTLRNLQAENRRLKDELKNLESAKTDVEVRLQLAAEKTDALAMQLQESEQRIVSLQVEVESLKESKGIIEDQMENQKSINEDLDTQLTVAKAKLNEVWQKFSSLEVELEDRSHCCEELEATCLELQLELESIGKKEALNYNSSDGGKQSRQGWEITAAPAKLAEHQETVLDFGKQLKSLTSSMGGPVFGEAVTSHTSTGTATRQKSFAKRFSLRDQMLAEDNAKAIILRSPAEDAPQTSSFHHTSNSQLVLVQTPYAYFGSKNNPSDALVGNLAIVPSKKQGFGLLRKLLTRRKKPSGKKARSVGKP